MVANGMEGVPWMTGGGAKHSANVGRVLAFMAAGGAAGVSSPGDLKVSASGTADKFVHVATGALSIINREGNARNEAYVARGTSVSDVEISPTGSSARSDLITLRVRDPQFGYALASGATAADGPYVFPEVIPGVPSNTARAEMVASLLNKAVYAVARIDVPANATGPAITDGMIKDLRKLAQPHFLPYNDLQKGPAAKENVLVTDTGWKNFPSNSTSVEVPPWATHADVEVSLLGLHANAAADVDTRINLGGITGPTFHFDYNGASRAGLSNTTESFQHLSQGSLDVRSIAGTTQTLRLNAMRVATYNTGEVWMDSNAQVRFRVEFFERVV